MRMTGMQLAQAAGGRWRDAVPDEVAGISTDSRSLKPGEAFLALRGPRFDGHAFGADVAGRASALIGDARGAEQWKALNVPVLIVDDTLAALGDIARAWRRMLAQTHLIALTGSVGKTSLRSMLEQAFSRLGLRVSATRANLNNLIGVPLTLLNVPMDAQIAVVECGVSEPGEMKRLASVVEPDAVALTAIAPAHSAGLGDLVSIAREKATLLQSLKPEGAAYLGAGVAHLLEQAGIRPGPGWLSLDDALSWNLRGRTLVLERRNETAEIPLLLPAAHWAHNLALAALIVLDTSERLGRPCSLADTARLLAGWEPLPGRMRPLRMPDGALVLDDCYNANPASMKAALDTLRALPGRHVAVLGDMAELGDESVAAHRGLDVDGIDELWLVGEQMKHLADRVPTAHWHPDAGSAAEALAGKRFGADATILVKGSRSQHLETVLDALMQRERRHAV